MRLKYLLFMFLLLALVLPLTVLAEGVDSSPRFIATYFLTNVRCPSCLTIERLTAETIQGEFADMLDSGLLQWRTINIDGEGNFHYVKDYKLYTKSVIISENVGGREVRWRNLSRVWELLTSEAEFRSYLREEIQAFMTGP